MVLMILFNGCYRDEVQLELRQQAKGYADWSEDFKEVANIVGGGDHHRGVADIRRTGHCWKA